MERPVTNELLGRIATHETLYGEKPERLYLLKCEYEKLRAELAPYLIAKARQDEPDSFAGVPLEIIR